MESLVNTLVLSALSASLVYFVLTLYNVLRELYGLYYTIKPKENFKVGDIIDRDFRITKVYSDGGYWAERFIPEILKEEVEEKIRIPMVRFEDIPFAIIEPAKEKETKRVTALDAYNEVIRDKELKLADEEYRIPINIGGLSLNDPTRTAQLSITRHTESTIQIEDNRQKQKTNYVWDLDEPEILKKQILETDEYVWKNGECWPKDSWDAKQKEEEYSVAHRNWKIEQQKSRYSHAKGGIIRKIPDPRINIPTTLEDFEKLSILELCPNFKVYETIMLKHSPYPSHIELCKIRRELETQHKIRSLNNENKNNQNNQDQHCCP